jgi:hypothetical protein
MDSLNITPEKNLGESATIELRKPIEAHGRSIDTLLLKRPKAGHLRRMGIRVGITGDETNHRMEFDPFDVVCRYLDVMADIPRSSIDNLEPADLFKVLPVVMGFLLDGQTDGKTSSGT